MGAPFVRLKTSPPPPENADRPRSLGVFFHFWFSGQHHTVFLFGGQFGSLPPTPLLFSPRARSRSIDFPRWVGRRTGGGLKNGGARFGAGDPGRGEPDAAAAGGFARPRDRAGALDFRALPKGPGTGAVPVGGWAVRGGANAGEGFGGFGGAAGFCFFIFFSFNSYYGSRLQHT